MISILSLLSARPYINLPFHYEGWIAWFCMLGILFAGVRLWWDTTQTRLNKKWWFWLLLVLLIPLTSLFLGVHLNDWAMPFPNLPVEPAVPTIMFLSALPWVLAAGLAGVLPGVLIGGISGFFLALWVTHSPFTPLETAGMALLFSAAVNQPYRTLFFKILRHPIGAAFSVCIVFIPVALFSIFFMSSGNLAVRIDYALKQTPVYLFTRTGELLIASWIAEILFITRREVWGKHDTTLPSPAEKSLQKKFFNGIAPLVLGLILTLVISDWVIAGSAARLNVTRRLSSTARVVSESLPYFLETGQTLIQTQAEIELMTTAPENRSAALAQRLRSVPFFKQYYLLDSTANVIASYPVEDVKTVKFTKEETEGFNQALKGVAIQNYTITGAPGESAARISFIAAVIDSSRQTKGILVAYTDLAANLFTQPAIRAFEDMRTSGGQGLILDGNFNVLYQTLPTALNIESLRASRYGESCFDGVSTKGVPQIVCYQPVNGKDWQVFVSTPVEQAQQLALDIAWPLLGMLVLLSAIGIVGVRIGLSRVTLSLNNLSKEAALISQGQLDHPLQSEGEDEVGQLAGAFERMRKGLKASLGELRQLLTVSQGVAANLEIGDAIQPVLRAALGNDACLARLVFIREVTLDPQNDRPVSFGMGRYSDVCAYLDQQIFELLKQQEMLVIPNTMRGRRIQFMPSVPRPGAILALPLYHESNYFGALWVGYETPRSFTEENVHFLRTIASEAALAASNARLYASAEIGRQRLEAVLDSTPDPVLVFDEKMRLTLLNSAALQLPGLISTPVRGKLIREVVTHPELQKMLVSPEDSGVFVGEISLPNKSVFLASVSSIVAAHQNAGKVCMLRDITDFKEHDAIKSEFVSTVSHDLRNPLMMLSGYANMLQNVGELNEQQKSYTGKIIDVTEKMNRLVMRLLNLGRIEAGVGLQIEALNAESVIDQTLANLQPQAAQKNIQIEKEMGQGILLQSDPDLLQQALFNLLENAIKFTPMKGQVGVYLTVLPETVTIEIRDTGIGIAPVDLPHIFERFFRSGRREASQQRGTGLGLAIVKSIAERLGGKVWVESQLGRGSSFFLEIPKTGPVK